MDSTTIAISILAVALLVIAWRRKGRQQALKGVEGGWRLLLNFLPRLLMGFCLAGLIQVLVPQEIILQLLGKEAGLQGILIGTALGMAAPGGPYIWYPLAATLLAAGAGVGPITAFLVAWNTTSIYTLVVWRLPFLGTSFSFALMIVSLGMPVLAGLFTPIIFDWVTRVVGA